MKNSRAPSEAHELRSTGVLLCAIGVLIALVALGRSYTVGCLKSGQGDFKECWNDGLAIAGMNPGGPLSAGVVFGITIGGINKEKEKKEMYDKGYWTYNPSLTQETGDDRDTPDPQNPQGLR